MHLVNLIAKYYNLQQLLVLLTGLLCYNQHLNSYPGDFQESELIIQCKPMSK